LRLKLQIKQVKSINKKQKQTMQSKTQQK